MPLFAWLKGLIFSEVTGNKQTRRRANGGWSLGRRTPRSRQSSNCWQSIEEQELRVLLSASPIPTATVAASPLRVSSAAPYEFTVTYCDDVLVAAAGIGTGDVRVNGPNSYSQIATLVSLTPTADAMLIQATYSITAPGGTWDSADDGAYAITMLSSEVADNAGNFVPAGQIGSILVEPRVAVGPDAFGYQATVAPFSFTDIRFTGTRILQSVDDSFFELTDAALGGFQFPFYGTTYSNVFVSSNGVLTFTAGNTLYVNDDLSSTFTVPAIAALWDDVMTGTNGVKWRITGTGPNEQLIVQWDRARYYPNAEGTTTNISFQVILSEADGSIRFNYLDLAGADALHDEGLSATVGIKDAGSQGTRRLLISQNNGPNAFVGTGKSVLIQQVALEGWLPIGPFSATDGQVENITPNDQIAGSVHALLAHPTDPNVLYAGATNGGIWRTDNAQQLQPQWRPLTDDLPSLSIGAMAFDTADATSNTIYAGIGRYSSYAQIGGDRIGLVRSTDGGTTWQIIDGSGTLRGKNISGLAVNGSTIIVSVNVADSFTFGNVGIFRSTDGGATFAQISVGDGTSTGLPGGVSYDLAVDPITPSTLYTSVVFSGLVGGLVGVYKTTDSGATWTKVSTAGMDALIENGSNSQATSNLEIAVGQSNNVYAAILNRGALTAIYRSGDGGTSWTQMDTPVTNENGTNVGLNPGGGKGPGAGNAPELIAGGQGSIHFSIVADPTNANVVYVGGDRQPLEFQNPTSIGARDFSGRLFRGNASLAAGSQWVHLTHSSALGASGGGTFSNSAPHADSRELVFDAGGDLIEADDGGVYVRTSPQDNTGDWFSLTGNLQITEAHDVAWDSVSHTAITGNQDTGTTYQSAAGANLWTSLSTADGGDVLVDDISGAAIGQSTRYSSFQNLGNFRRTTWDAAGALLSTAFPSLTLVTGSAITPAFRTPMALNSVDPSRLIVQGRNGIYESTDRGDTINQISTTGVSGNGLDQSAIVSGGVSGGVPNADILWVGSGTEPFLRSTAGGALNVVTSPTTDGEIRDLATDPNEWRNSFVIDNDQVSFTTNAGLTWTDVTGNLLALTRDLRTLTYISTSVIDAIVVATGAGVFASPIGIVGTLGDWVRLSDDLPNAVAFDLEYDAIDDVLVVSFMGRGAWLLGDVASAVIDTFVDFDFGDAPAPYPVRLSESGPRHVARGIMLGSTRDFEADGFHSTGAVGDDTNNLTDDEDGVRLDTGFEAGQLAQITVTVSQPGFVSAFLDANGNGSLLNAGEEVVSGIAVVVGDNLISFIVPVGAASMLNTLLRVHAYTGVLNPSGITLDGEVEDVAVTVFPPPQLSVSIVPSSISENGGTSTGTVTRSTSNLASSLTVTLSSSDTTEATVPASVIIPAGMATATFAVMAVDDTLLDGSQTVILTVAASGFTSGTANVTVTDFETLSVSIVPTTIGENYGVNAATGTVTRNNTDLALPVIVTLTSGDPARLSVPGSFVIPAGAASANFAIDAIDDFVLQGTVNIFVTATSAGYEPGSFSSVQVLDNELSGLTVIVSGGSTLVTEAGGTDSFTVALTQQPLSNVVIAVSSSSPAEATVSPVLLTFTPADWATVQTVVVTGVNDAFVDGDRSITVTLSIVDANSDLLYGDVADTAVTVINADNEVAGLLIVESGGSTIVSEPNGSDTLTVRLIDRPLGNVVLTLAMTDNTEAFVLSTNLTFTPANWDQPQTVTINGLDDVVADGSVVSQLRFSIVQASTHYAFDNMPDVNVSVTTVDNEVGGFTVTQTFGSTQVSESGTTDTVLIRLTAQPVSDVVLTISGLDVTEASASSATLTFTSANWNIVQTLTLTGLDDLLFDGPQLSQLRVAVDPALSADAFDGVAPTLIPVTTVDNEPLPPTVLSPPTDTRTSFPTFTWTAVAGAVSYDIWVGNLLSLAGPVINTTVTGTSFTSPIALELARHRVWVRANLSSGITTPWSAFRQFDVRTPPTVQPPLARFQETYRPTVSWTPVPNVASYQVQVDSRFTAPMGLVLVAGITGTSFTIPTDLPLGLYKIWIRALGTNGNWSAWSNPEDFYIAVAPTPAFPGESTFDTTPTFRWNSVIGGREYRIRVFNTLTQQLVIDQGGITGLEFTPTTPLAVGPHRWNVQAKGEHDVVGNWSAGRLVEIGGRTQITAPTGTTSGQPMFRWQNVDDAFTYTIWITRFDNTSSPLVVNNIIGNSFTPTSALTAGVYRVWVRAVSSSGQISNWSNSQVFTVVDADTPESSDHFGALVQSSLTSLNRVTVRSDLSSHAETGMDSADAVRPEVAFAEWVTTSQTFFDITQPAPASPTMTVARLQSTAQPVKPIVRYEDEELADLVLAEWHQLEW